MYFDILHVTNILNDEKRKCFWINMYGVLKQRALGNSFYKEWSLRQLSWYALGAIEAPMPRGNIQDDQ